MPELLVKRRPWDELGFSFSNSMQALCKPAVKVEGYCRMSKGGNSSLIQWHSKLGSVADLRTGRDKVEFAKRLMGPI